MDRFRNNIISIHKEQGKAWLEKLPEIVEKLAKEWNLPNSYLQKARMLRDKLLRSTEAQVLLHGVLHHENILQNGEQWVVIDPKGVIGYPINEIWIFIIDIEKDTEFVANYFGFNLQEVRSWYFVSAYFSYLPGS